ncbi:MAG TPA: LptF/LptG family permease, partial [Opitutales bacterium]|nr:LptF/LptG family permease [Opitutales bacterium]
YKQGIIAALRGNPMQFLQPKVFIDDFPGYILYVGDRDGSELKDLWIWELNDRDEVRMLIKANSGVLNLEESTDTLVLTLSKGTGEHRSQPDLANIEDPMALPTLVFHKLDIRFPLADLFKGNEVQKKISMLTFNELIDRRAMYLERERAGDDKAFGERIRVQTQMQKAIAMAFGMLALTGIAIPLGIQANRAETYANITLALGLTLVYYFMIVMISWLEEAPRWRPDLLIWLPNILYQSLGLYLLHRSNKH